jgi:hypothetical protein
MNRYRTPLNWLVALLAGFTVATANAQITLTHVHGLAYSSDGKRLLIPSHHGLAVYESGKWTKTPGPRHDFMGFSATAKHLYSSGHPAPGSGLVNPFGLILSRDGGKTWDKLGLEGETDFHLVASSWNTNAIYVWNPAPSTRMRQPGLHYTLNDGFAWQPARAAGLEGDPHAIAVHPDNAAIVAVATSTGVFTSRDSGNSFTSVAPSSQGVSVFFDLDGKRLWYATFDGQALLARVSITAGKPAAINLPPIGRDAVAYIAQNPTARTEYAIATFERSVYVSRDAGRTWQHIADHGKAR